VDGAQVGTVGVDVEQGRSTRVVEVADEHREAALAALYRLLVRDDQLGA
jgi:hypothetical protein